MNATSSGDNEPDDVAATAPSLQLTAPAAPSPISSPISTLDRLESITDGLRASRNRSDSTDSVSTTKSDGARSFTRRSDKELDEVMRQDKDKEEDSDERRRSDDIDTRIVEVKAEPNTEDGEENEMREEGIRYSLRDRKGLRSPQFNRMFDNPNSSKSYSTPFQFSQMGVLLGQVGLQITASGGNECAI